MSPDFSIPGPYNVTFKNRLPGSVASSTVRSQVLGQNLGRFKIVIGLGGVEYRAIVAEAFRSSADQVRFPFAGLPIGKAMQAINRAIQSGRWLPDDDNGYKQNGSGHTEARIQSTTLRRAPSNVGLHKTQSTVLREGKMAPTTQDFQRALLSALATAQRQGQSYIAIKSGDLHRSVGEYPGPNHRMPMCCNVMRNNMKAGDEIVEEPPKGNGASLMIRYQLPR